MTAVTLRPSSPSSLADNSDATYVTISLSQSFAMTTVTLPAGAVTRDIQLRVRARESGGAAGMYGYLLLPQTPAIAVRSEMTGSFATYNGFQWPVTLTQAQINGLTIAINQYAGDIWTGDLQVAEAYVELYYVEQPVVVVTAITPDPYTASTIIPVAWTNTLDGSGGAQTRYQVVVIPESEFPISTVEDAVKTYDSGVVVSGLTSHDIGPITNGEYRVAVRVAQTVNGSPHWSEWVIEPDGADGFVVDVPSAEIDTLTATPNWPTGSITVTAERDAASEAWEWIEVQRSYDAGATWEDVRFATYVDATGDADTFTVADYAPPNSTDVRYRARATRIVSTLPITGAWVETIDTSWSSDDVWFKDPLDPSRNFTVCLVSAPDEVTQTRRGVFQILGAPEAVIISDVVSASSTAMTLYAYTVEAILTLKDKFAQPTIWLFQTPPTMPDGSKYVSVGSTRRAAVIPDRIRPRHTLALSDVIETTAPPDPTAGR